MNDFPTRGRSTVSKAAGSRSEAGHGRGQLATMRGISPPFLQRDRRHVQRELLPNKAKEQR
jgi:hypothetical protein